MWVKLKNTWFVGNRRFKRPEGGYPIEVPDKFRDQLPKSAKIVEGPKTAAQIEADHSKDVDAFDTAKASVDAENKANEQARRQIEEDRAKLATERAELEKLRAERPEVVDKAGPDSATDGPEDQEKADKVKDVRKIFNEQK